MTAAHRGPSPADAAGADGAAYPPHRSSGLQRTRSEIVTVRATWAMLGSILVLAALLRVPSLDRVPNGLFLDEASRGYDAYALLRTGADQYGVPWPLFAEGLDDYTPILYTLLVLPSVAAFGLTEFAVRLPAALAGVATVLTVFLCGRALFQDAGTSTTGASATKNGTLVGLIGAALVAISPWHILPSRTGAEWVLLPLFMTTGIWLLARGCRSGHSGPNLLLAGLVLGVGLYSYAFARLLVPLLVAGCVALWWRNLLANWRWAAAGALLLALLAVPILQFGLTPAGQARFQTVVPLAKHPGLSLVPYYQGNLASYFDPSFLIWGSEPTHHHRLAGFGPLLWLMVPLVVAGLVSQVRRPARGGLFCLWWIVAAPASAALHRESPSSVLLLGGVGSWHLLAGLGVASLVAWMRTASRPIQLALAGVTLLGYSLTAGTVAQALFRAYPAYSAADWLYGSREAIKYLEAHRDQYDGVLVSDRLATPHILVLFYTGMDPASYQHAPIHVEQPDVRSRGTAGPYQFGRTSRLLEQSGRFLVWLPASDARDAFRNQEPLLTIRLPDGQPTQYVYETDRR
ncbi:MAG: glycosyltransferase family 39 protein [Chloroflexota bacterium]